MVQIVASASGVASDAAVSVRLANDASEVAAPAAGVGVETARGRSNLRRTSDAEGFQRILHTLLGEVPSNGGSRAIKLAQEAAPAVAEDNSLLLIGGGGFAVLVPLIVVVFVVSSQGVFKTK